MTVTYQCDRCGAITHRPYLIDFLQSLGLETRRADLCDKCAAEFAEWCGLDKFADIIRRESQ